MARSFLILGCVAASADVAQLRGASNQTVGPFTGASRTISKHVLYDKLMGYWVGQLVGNFMGLPFEFLYTDSPMPIEPQTYYDQNSAHSSGLRCNSDGRGRIPQRLSQLQGAYTDAPWLELSLRLVSRAVAESLP